MKKRKISIPLLLTIVILSLAFFFLLAYSQNKAVNLVKQSEASSSETLYASNSPVQSGSVIVKITNSSEAQTLLKQAESTRWTDKDLEKAEKLYWEVISKYPDTYQAVEAHLGLGGLYRWDMKPPKLKEAADVYERVLHYTSYEKIHDVYLQLGGVYQYDMVPSEDVKAALVYKELIANYPETKEANNARMRLASIYGRLAKIEKQPEYYKQKRDYYRMAIEKIEKSEKPDENPLIPEAKVQLANTYLFDLEDYGAALDLYKEIMKKWPGTKYAYEALLWSSAVRYRERKEITADQAIEIFEQITELPDSFLTNGQLGGVFQKDSYWLNVKASARYNVGYVQYWRGRGYLAIKEFQRVLDEYGDVAYDDLTAQSYLFIGHIREQQDQLELALKAYERAMEVVPNSRYCVKDGEIPARIDRVKTQMELQKP